MLGKIAAAMIGSRVTGRNKGATGAVAGVVVESLAKRVITALAAAVVLGYAYKKAKDVLGGNDAPAYPSEASPSPPPPSPPSPSSR